MKVVRSCIFYQLCLITVLTILPTLRRTPLYTRQWLYECPGAQGCYLLDAIEAALLSSTSPSSDSREKPRWCWPRGPGSRPARKRSPSIPLFEIVNLALCACSRCSPSGTGPERTSGRKDAPPALKHGQIKLWTYVCMCIVIPGCLREITKPFPAELFIKWTYLSMICAKLIVKLI